MSKHRLPSQELFPPFIADPTSNLPVCHSSGESVLVTEKGNCPLSCHMFA